MLIKLILIGAVVGLLAWARKARPAVQRSGQLLNDAELATTSVTHKDRDSFNVATYNVQTGKSLEGKRDIYRSATIMTDADLVGVQEVYAPSLLNRFGITCSQAQALASKGKFAWLFCATRIRWFREHRGNLLLSKLAISSWRVEMLPDQSGKSFRNMTIAQVSWQDQQFHFINTHLHTRQGREQQLDSVLREFAKYPRAILVGDFNSRADTPLLKQALLDIEISDAISLAGLDQGNADRIDWILTKGFTVHGGEMVEKGVSDHPYYLVSLSIK